jgi:hypothetical protein
MKTNRERALDILSKCIDSGISDTSILEFLIENHMDGYEAYQAMLAVEEEFFNDSVDDEDEYSYHSTNDED